MEFCYIHSQQQKRFLLWVKHDLNTVHEQLLLHGNAFMPKTSGNSLRTVTPLTCDLLISSTASRKSISSYALTMGSSSTKHSEMTVKASQLYPISGKNFRKHDRKLTQTHQ